VRGRARGLLQEFSATTALEKGKDLGVAEAEKEDRGETKVVKIIRAEYPLFADPAGEYRHYTERGKQVKFYSQCRGERADI